MKNNEITGTPLGFKQDEIAAILSISRGLWSMYTTGRRQLPSKAQLELAKIENHIASAKMDADQNKLDKSVAQAELKNLLTEIKFQQTKTARELANAERKRESSLNALHLVNYLNSKSETKKKAAGFSKFIEERSNKGLEQNGIALITRLKIKLGTLQHEEKLVKTALRELT